MNVERSKLIAGVKRITVKVGTSTLTHNTGKINLAQMERLVREIVDLTNQGREIVLVTSGAVGAGIGRLGYKQKPKTMPEKQAAAAVGQGILLHMYEKLFAEYGKIVAQVLLTREDLADRRRYLNARNTLLTLLSKQVIPIVNENDTVAVEEIKVGDNDMLSALVAGLVDAEFLVLLTDTDGLFTADPRINEKARVISCVYQIDDNLRKLAGGVGSNWATGGMGSKISAAEVAMNSGIPLVIASGLRQGVLMDLLQGKEIGTLFVPRDSRLRTKKRWIAFGSEIRGKLHIDAGAVLALKEKGKSLLPIGITEVEGDFGPGSVVSIVGPDGKEIARGMVNYLSAEICKIMGKNSVKIEEILGHKDFDEVVHRDNMVINKD